MNRVDPSYVATQLHFADLMERYGSPILVLNLVKQNEKMQREMIVGQGFRQAVECLNTFIEPPFYRIRYVALDYSRLSKMRLDFSSVNQKLPPHQQQQHPQQQHRNVEAVRQALEDIGTWALDQTGFFCSAPKRHLGTGIYIYNMIYIYI